MFILECPNCGPRNVSEFRYGGEVQGRPDPNEASVEEWTQYLYMRQNKLGYHYEWWYHRAGCGKWFIAERHTQSHELRATRFWSSEAAP